ncbi:MAG: GNAT family N-acetyltransferase [Ktedonobacterales bacterium]
MEKPKYLTALPIFEELRGERVLLRPYRLDDSDDMYAAIEASRDHLRPWMPWADQSAEQQRDWLVHRIASWLLREDLIVGIWEAATGRSLGGSGLHGINWEIGAFEIGYWLRADAEGKGYMTETVRLLTDYAFDMLDANRVAIRCDAENRRSAAVAARLGFVREGCLRSDTRTADGTLRDTLVFSLIRSDPRWPTH